jgi:hypothetical protein
MEVVLTSTLQIQRLADHQKSTQNNQLNGQILSQPLMITIPVHNSKTALLILETLYSMVWSLLQNMRLLSSPEIERVGPMQVTFSDSVQEREVSQSS